MQHPGIVHLLHQLVRKVGPYQESTFRRHTFAGPGGPLLFSFLSLLRTTVQNPHVMIRRHAAFPAANLRSRHRSRCLSCDRLKELTEAHLKIVIIDRLTGINALFYRLSDSLAGFLKRFERRDRSLDFSHFYELRIQRLALIGVRMPRALGLSCVKHSL